MAGRGQITNRPNMFGTTGDPEYPTAIYTLNGEPRAFSGDSFVMMMHFAINAKRYADTGVALIFTDSKWDI